MAEINNVNKNHMSNFQLKRFAHALKNNINKLKRRIQVYKEEMSCNICQINGVEVLFLDCHHMVTCSTCANNVTTCPLCGGIVSDQINIDGVYMINS